MSDLLDDDQHTSSVSCVDSVADEMKSMVYQSPELIFGFGRAMVQACHGVVFLIAWPGRLGDRLRKRHVWQLYQPGRL